MRPIERFLALPAVVAALRDQFLVHGDAALAAALARVAVIEEHAPEIRLIEQGGADNHVYFILMGEVSIIVNGQEMALRKAGQHVGDMALIDPGARRSATVVARDTVVTAFVKEPDFTAIAAEFPQAWRRIACELGDRLRQRTRFIRQKNETPILFLGSSRESLPIAQGLVDGWEKPPFIVRPWTGGVFTASHFPIDDLAKQVIACDFAALVLGPDDEVISRGERSSAPRDNVLFELGLFMGALERPRTFLIVPRDVDIKIPTDLLGLTPIKFTFRTGTLAENLAPVCQELSGLIGKMGAR